MKLYLKKLIAMTLYGLLFLLIYPFIGDYIVMICALFENVIISNFVYILIIANIISFVFFKKRLNDSTNKRNYKESLTQKPYSFFEDIKSSLKTEEFKIELLAFSTLMVLYFFRLLFTGDNPSFLINFINALIIIIIYFLTYTITNLMNWNFVHKRWIKDGIIHTKKA